MCLTWNADFYWCNGYPGPYVPIMSGGLLALSRYWWETTGGYDDDMHAWGGENLDQSLRTWLCGGEIVVADTARVAHMWRDPNKPKTVLHYAIPTEHVLRNRLRAATSWMGPWAKKVQSFPEYDDFKPGGHWHLGSLENVESYQKALQCKGFKSYLDRFEDLYASMGGLPKVVFNLREKRSQLCFHHELTYGSQQGGKMVLRPCNRESEAQRWHFANARGDGSCCSGLKLWDIDICLGSERVGKPAHAENCFNFGESASQYFKLTDAGQLEWQDGKGCIAPSKADLEAQTSIVEKRKATMLLGRECSSHVELLSSGEQQEFRVVAGQLCLSFTEADNGRPLMFLPCQDGDRRQVFRYGHNYEGTHTQLLTSSDGFCIDAASGGGPLVYQCYPIEDKNPQQMFIAKAGAAMVWEKPFTGGEVQPFCIEPMTNIVGFTVCALDGQGHPKTGQAFVKHDKQNDGSFQLKISGTGECLSHGEVNGQTMLIGKPCKDDPQQRWTAPAGGQLRNVGVGLCVDANDNEHPILYTCYAPGQNKKQSYSMHENGMLEIPRSWADNGRVRYLSKCFDSRLADPVPLSVEQCEDASASGVAWEQIWQETPLETQLFLDASKSRGNLRAGTS